MSSELAIEPSLVITGCSYLEEARPGHAQFSGPVDIAVAEGAIASITPTGEIVPDGPVEVIDGRGLVAFPGFINGHTHAAMSLLRGVAEDVTIDEWFNDVVWPMEINLTEHDVYVGTLLAAAEMIEAGVTTFVDHYFFMDEAARAVDQSGLRANLGSAFFSSQGPEAVERSADFASRLHRSAGGRITTSLAPHATYTCDDADLAKAAEYAAELGIRVHIHAAETIEQTESSIAKRGMTPIEVLDVTGILDVGAIIAHGKGIIDRDLPLLAARSDRVGIPHSAKGYLKTGTTRLTPIRELLGAGVAVGLGTDGAASHNTLDLLESLRFMVISQKFVTHDPHWMDIGTALQVAGPLSARAIGMDSEIGALVVGRRADIILVDLSGLHCQPIHDVGAAFLYSARASDVRTTICDGKVLMRDRKLVTIDKAELLAEAADRALTISDRSHGRTLQTYDP